MSFRTVEWLDHVASTSAALAARLARGRRLPPGTVLAAREQTAGRGRGGRSWATGAGRDLACSFTWEAPEGAHAASLSQAVALGVSDYLRAEGIAALTKWPNDVLVDERKICGILVEQAGAAGPPVVGVGLNVNMTRDEAAAIDRPATSMMIDTGRAFEVGAVLEILLQHLAPRLQAWSAGGFEAIRSDWEARTAWTGMGVCLLDGDTELTGRLSGFGPDGELLLERDDGSTTTVWTGDLLRLDRT